MVSIMAAGILLTITGAAAVWWMKPNPQKPSAPSEEVVVAKASSPASTIPSDTKASPRPSIARAPEKQPVPTDAQTVPQESSATAVAPPKSQSAARTEPPRVADKKPQETSKTDMAKPPAPKADTKAKAEVQTPPSHPRPVDKSGDVVRDVPNVKPRTPADLPKPDSEAVSRNAPPSPPPTASPKKPKAEPLPVAGSQLVASKLAQFNSIDKHALAAPAEAEQSIPTLTAYLVKPARNDLEKVRAMYRWITDRIAYDVEDFFSGRPGVCLPEEVLKRRVAVCEGYSRLFKAMCDHAQVEAVVISGYGKGLGYEPAGNLDACKHAWNAVKLDGAWYLLDITWAAGATQRNGFVKQLNDFFYLTRPDQFVFKHLPQAQRWQLLRDPVNLEQWQALPMVDETLFAGGVSSQDIKKTAQRKTFRGLVKAYPTFGLPLVIHQAPLDKHLVTGSTLSIRIEAPQFLKMAIVNEGKWHDLTRKGDVFTGSTKLQKGTVRVSAMLPDKGDQYWTVLEYVVEERATAALPGLPNHSTSASNLSTSP